MDSHAHGASESEVELLLRFSQIPVPSDYLRIVKEMTEIEVLIPSGKYVRIWGPTGCVEMNSAYKIQEYIPQSLAVGDDECDSALILMNGGQGFGLYKVGFGDLSAEDAEFIAPSIDSFLAHGVGVENI